MKKLTRKTAFITIGAIAGAVISFFLSPSINIPLSTAKGTLYDVMFGKYESTGNFLTTFWNGRFALDLTPAIISLIIMGFIGGLVGWIIYEAVKGRKK